VTPPNEPTSAALEATLAAVQQEKADLEKIVQGLQQDLAAQQSRLFELTDSLDQAQADLKAKTAALQQTEEALAEAKATILKLSAPAPAPVVPAPSRPAQPRRSGGDIIPRQPITGSAHPGYVRGVPTYTSQTEQPNPMLSDADIGWVD
jgi:Tfp pilus assembly protein FimV